MNTWKIEGTEAIRIAERDGVTLQKYADPVEGYRNAVSISEAKEIAKTDPNLIYCIVQPSGWTARSGATYLGPDCDGVEPTWENI